MTGLVLVALIVVVLVGGATIGAVVMRQDRQQAQIDRLHQRLDAREGTRHG